MNTANAGTTCQIFLSRGACPTNSPRRMWGSWGRAKGDSVVGRGRWVPADLRVPDGEDRARDGPSAGGQPGSGAAVNAPAGPPQLQEVVGCAEQRPLPRRTLLTPQTE